MLTQFVNAASLSYMNILLKHGKGRWMEDGKINKSGEKDSKGERKAVTDSSKE